MNCPICNHDETYHRKDGCCYHNECDCEYTALDVNFIAQIARLQAIEKAARGLINNLPPSVIEEAREVWLNTNTRIILEARQALAATLTATGSEGMK